MGSQGGYHTHHLHGHDDYLVVLEGCQPQTVYYEGPAGSLRSLGPLGGEEVSWYLAGRNL